MKRSNCLGMLTLALGILGISIPLTAEENTSSAPSPENVTTAPVQQPVVSPIGTSDSTTLRITNTYDALNRLTGVDYGNGTKITYSYDANGNRTSREVTIKPQIKLAFGERDIEIPQSQSKCNVMLYPKNVSATEALAILNKDIPVDKAYTKTMPGSACIWVTDSFQPEIANALKTLGLDPAKTEITVIERQSTGS